MGAATQTGYRGHWVRYELSIIENNTEVIQHNKVDDSGAVYNRDLKPRKVNTRQIDYRERQSTRNVQHSRIIKMIVIMIILIIVLIVII